MAGSKPGSSWLDVVAAVGSGIDDGALPFCPACGQLQVDYMYVGDPVNRTGYLGVWCDACRRGVRISRARAPIDAHFMAFTTPDSIFTERVPTFTEVPLKESELSD
jgi:hypothetical protein